MGGQKPGKWKTQPVPDTQKLLTHPPNDAGRLSYTPEHPQGLKIEIYRPFSKNKNRGSRPVSGRGGVGWGAKNLENGC